jgi:AcrR family transcriptional regulator
MCRVGVISFKNVVFEKHKTERKRGEKMESQKPNRKVRYTKKVLAESLVELLREKSISDVSIKELCARADINRSTFYAHYKDQYGVLQEIEDTVLETFEQIRRKYALEPPQKALLRTIEATIDHIAGNVDCLQILLSEQGDIHFQRKLFSLIHEKQIMKFKSDEPVDEITKEYYITFSLNGSIAIVQHWIKNDMNLPKEKLVRLLFKLIGQK